MLRIKERVVEEKQLCWNEKNSFKYANLTPCSLNEGSDRIYHKISSFTEFDPIKSVIVGYIDQSACLSQDLLQAGCEDDKIQNGKVAKQIVDQAQRDQNMLAKKLIELGIEVVRPGKVDWSQPYDVQGFQTRGFCTFSPRDIPFIYHDSMYEFPTFNITRLQEYKAFEWIEQQLNKNGSKIFSSWDSITKGYRYYPPTPQKLNTHLKEDQYFADAANLLKLGLDILFLISSSGSKGCYKKFRSMMEQRYQGKVRVHPIEKSYPGVHVDTTFTVLGYNKKVGKNLVMFNGEYVNKKNMPAIFRGKNWAAIQINEYDQQHFDQKYDYVSDAIGLNFLMVNPQLAIISNRQQRLKKVLQFYGIQVITMNNKHTKQLAGGFHCATNQINREDTYNFEKVLNLPRQELRRQELAGLFDLELLTMLQKEGKVQDWVEICNKKQIYGTYLTDHLGQEAQTA